MNIVRVISDKDGKSFLLQVNRRIPLNDFGKPEYEFDSFYNATQAANKLRMELYLAERAPIETLKRNREKLKEIYPDG